MNWRRLIPNSISSASLIFGVLSIFKTIEGDFFLAPVFIVIAVIFDSMDGRAARALGVGGGDFGKEMDSLCDMSSFGVAPAIMIYMYGLQDLGLAGQVIAALFAVGGCLRLARFNCNTGVVHGYFQGMPIPAGACFLATYVVSGYQFAPAVLAAVTLVIACIMYSEVKFPDFKARAILCTVCCNYCRNRRCRNAVRASRCVAVCSNVRLYAGRHCKPCLPCSYR